MKILQLGLSTESGKIWLPVFYRNQADFEDNSRRSQVRRKNGIMPEKAYDGRLGGDEYVERVIEISPSPVRVGSTIFILSGPFADETMKISKVFPDGNIEAVRGEAGTWLDPGQFIVTSDLESTIP